MFHYGFSKVNRNIDTTITAVDSYCRLAKSCTGTINTHGRSYSIRRMAKRRAIFHKPGGSTATDRIITYMGSNKAAKCQLGGSLVSAKQSINVRRRPQKQQ